MTTHTVFTSQNIFSISLIIAGLGILIEYLTGVGGFPKIPPGPILLIGAGLLVAIFSTRWIMLLGLLIALFISIGALIVFGVKGGQANQWIWPGPLLGTLIQIIGLVVAVPSGIVTVMHFFQK